MDNKSSYKVKLIEGTVNDKWIVAVALLLNTKDYMNFEDNLTLKELPIPSDMNLDEKGVDLMLYDIVKGYANYNPVCFSASIQIDLNLLSTGSIVGNFKDLEISSIEDGKIYKCDDNIFYFGYSGRFSIIGEGDFDKTFKLRNVVESFEAYCDIEASGLFNASRELKIKKLILTRDGTGVKNKINRLIEYYEDV